MKMWENIPKNYLTKINISISNKPKGDLYNKKFKMIKILKFEIILSFKWFENYFVFYLTKIIFFLYLNISI